MLIQYHQTRNVISGGSRNRLDIQQRERSSTITSHVKINGTPPATHPNSNRQFNGLWNLKQKFEPKTFKSNGHAIVLGTRSNQTKKVQSILGAWRRKSCRLLHQSPLPNASQRDAPPVCAH
jgi:hypothetical protein